MRVGEKAEFDARRAAPQRRRARNSLQFRGSHGLLVTASVKRLHLRVRRARLLRATKARGAWQSRRATSGDRSATRTAARARRNVAGRPDKHAPIPSA
jgi:hypothetical protein